MSPRHRRASIAPRRVLPRKGSTLDADAVLNCLPRTWLTGSTSGAATDGFAAIRSAWVARAMPIGRALEIKTNDGPVAGTFAGLDHDGALLIDLAPDNPAPVHVR